MRKRGWGYDTPRNGLRRRVLSLASDRHPWWDWGHRLMILTGDDASGNWGEPTPTTWWYRLGTPRRMTRTGYPIHPLRSIQIVTDYKEFRALTEGLDEDEMYQWKAIGTNQDGELVLGKQWWGGPFFGLSSWEMRILSKWLRRWRRHDWWGVRSWLYAQGLHATVYKRKPLSCGQPPPKGQGGYSHWLCQLRRGHDGLHRFHSYQWGEIGGETIGATHVPEVRG